MSLLRDDVNCCGCGACVDICPTECIRLLPIGKLNALLPEKDDKECVSCNLCNTVCPKNNQLVLENFKKKVYAAKSVSDDILLQSSSGGMFSVFAQKLMLEDYIIFGAKFDKSLKLIQDSASDIDELKKLCKSKYIQSNSVGIYKRIKMLLKNGQKVMFTGTPCQCKALQLFLNKKYDNLVVVDFFCHGVPSQVFFDKCKSLYEDSNKCVVNSYQFRTKIKNAASPHYYSIEETRKGKQYRKTKIYYKSPYYAAFQSYLNLRESCYNCCFSDSERASDITIGDFHDIEKYDNGEDRFKGISMVLINTNKGRLLFDKCCDDLEYKEYNIEQMKNDKQIFSGGTNSPNKRKEFIKDYENIEFEELIKKWFPGKKYFMQGIYYSMPKKIRKIIKSLGGY